MIRFYLILMIGCCCNRAVYAQMMAVPMNISTPNGNVKSYYYVSSPTHNSYYGQSNAGVKYEFTIVLKNDSTFAAKTRINFANSKLNSITIRKNKKKQKLFPSDTKTISRITEEGKELHGIPADSCWLFKAYTGKINVYSFLAEQGLDFAIAIQDGDAGAIVPLTADNLAMMVGVDDPKINRMIEKRKFTDAILAYNKKDHTTPNQ